MYLTINFRLRLSKSKKSKKGSKISKSITNEVATIRCVVSVNSQPEIPFSTKMYVVPSDWVQDVQRVRLECEQARFINRRLDTIERDLENLFEQMTRYGDTITTQQLIKFYTEPEKAIPDAVQLWDIYLNEEIKPKIGNGSEDITEGTFKKYVKARNHFAEFVEFRYKRKIVALNEIGTNQAKEYRNWLKLQLTKYKKPFSNDYCTRTVEYTKNMLKFGMKKGFISTNPFDFEKFKRENRAIKFFLKEHEIKKIYHKEDLSEIERQAADIFVFCCYTGLSYADYFEFDYRLHLQESELGQDIVINRFKNRKYLNHDPCYIPLLPVADEILKKYRYQLPKICNQVLNKVIKRVASQAGIMRASEVTMHIARKSAGCYLLNNDVPIESVAKILGHTDIKITQKHYAFLLNDTVARHTAHLRIKNT